MPTGSRSSVWTVWIRFAPRATIYPEMMYVSDVETHELLFLNESDEEFSSDSIEGKRCYEVFHGRSEPCPFCGFSDYDNIVTWE